MRTVLRGLLFEWRANWWFPVGIIGGLVLCGLTGRL